MAPVSCCHPSPVVAGMGAGKAGWISLLMSRWDESGGRLPWSQTRLTRNIAPRLYNERRSTVGVDRISYPIAVSFQVGKLDWRAVTNGQFARILQGGRCEYLRFFGAYQSSVSSSFCPDMRWALASLDRPRGAGPVAHGSRPNRRRVRNGSRAPEGCSRTRASAG
jgi:hypothetical protein